MTRRRRRGSGARLALLAALAGLAVVALVAGPTFVHRYGDGLFSTSRCTVTIDGAVSSLTAEQADNAALIAATALRRGLPNHAVTVALATALQESDLRNLDYGDRDSLGLFQQRPSQGWGTAEQIQDPRFAANAFYDHLEDVAGWAELPVTEAAQAVQRSGHPLAYADHEADARLWARVLTGEVRSDAVTCSLSSRPEAAQAAQAFATRVTEDFGARVATSIATTADGVETVEISSGDEALSEAVAAWSVAVAAGWPVTDISLCGARWARDDGSWHVAQVPESECTNSVVIRLAAN